MLVVGGGNTGYQIAAELADSRPVHLAVGSAADTAASAHPRPGPVPLPRSHRPDEQDRDLAPRSQRLKDRETLIGSSPRAARKLGIEMRPRATAADGATVTFADGSDLTVDAVVWATGFRPDHSFVDLPVFDGDGQVRHRRGVTDVPGLYFLGLPWQHTRGSALLGWVKDDAEHLAQRIGAFVPSPAPAGAR